MDLIIQFDPGAQTESNDRIFTLHYDYVSHTGLWMGSTFAARSTTDKLVLLLLVTLKKRLFIGMDGSMKNTSHPWNLPIPKKDYLYWKRVRFHFFF